MKQELQDKLYKKYPELFGQKNWSVRNSAMPWGIETGDGWYHIIDSMCLYLQSYIERKREERARNLIYNRALARAISGNRRDLRYFYRKLYKNDEEINLRVEEELKYSRTRPVPESVPQIQFTQIKEKFGGLRVYTNYCNDYIDGVVNMAVGMSYKLCETCGNPGKKRGNGWMYVACEEHANKKDTDMFEDENK